MAQIGGVGPFWLAWVGQFSEAAKFIFQSIIKRDELASRQAMKPFDNT